MPRQPNVVLVITDDQGYGDLACHGNPVIQTPNLDRFHDEAVCLTDFHVGPTCAPTRAGLLTGHYANSTGVWHTIGGRSLLRQDEWTLAAALREHGYRTGIFGKWHLGDAYPYRPHDRGFEIAVVHGGGGISQTPDHWGNDYFDDTYFVNGEPRPFQGYCTDVWFREALGFIAAHRDQPFFCYLATNAPHGPFNVENEYCGRYRGAVPEDRARFYGMITNIDQNFGVLRASLRAWGLEDDTILVFMTDNGSSTGARLDREGFVADGYNAGMRGLKGSPYDGGHRVPFFVRWPAGGLDRGADVEQLTANVDFMPTVLDLCGIPVPEERTFHGRSLVPLLRGHGEDWEDRTVVTDSQRVVRPVKWRQSAVMTGAWRLINGRELYAIRADGEQRQDVAPRHPAVVERLRTAYEEWWRLVSGQSAEEIPVVLGSDVGTEVCLTGHDWRNEDCSCPWNQGLVRQGMAANGHWEVDIRRAGEYAVELRRWPKEAGRAIAAGIDGDDVSWRRECVDERSWGMYTGGRALPVTEARLQIGDRSWTKAVGELDRDATFRVTLPAGPAHLQGWLGDGQGFTVGPYYVYVSCTSTVSVQGGLREEGPSQVLRAVEGPVHARWGRGWTTDCR